MQIWILLVRAFSYRLQLHTETLQTSTEKLPFGLNKRKCGGIEGISSWTTLKVWVSVDLSKLIISDKVALIEYSICHKTLSSLILQQKSVLGLVNLFFLTTSCHYVLIIKHCWSCSVPLKQTAAVSLQTLCPQHKPIAYFGSDGITTTPFQFFSSEAGALHLRDQNESDVLKCFHCLCWWGRQIRAKNTAINGWVYGGTPAVCGARSFI